METLARSQVRANRQKWIDFLKVKGRKKTKGHLDFGNGERCCLGHACYLFDKENRMLIGPEYYYSGAYDFPSIEVQNILGLWNEMGGANDVFTNLQVFTDDKLNRNTLADINDETSAGPNRIGKYLESVIEGGNDTPFRPLSDYPETI